jgi:hypothetical protein
MFVHAAIIPRGSAEIKSVMFSGHRAHSGKDFATRPGIEMIEIPLRAGFATETQRHRDIEKSDRARTYEALVDAIKEALATISESDIRAWFEFCGYSIQ